MEVAVSSGLLGYVRVQLVTLSTPRMLTITSIIMTMPWRWLVASLVLLPSAGFCAWLP